MLNNSGLKTEAPVEYKQVHLIEVEDRVMVTTHQLKLKVEYRV